MISQSNREKDLLEQRLSAEQDRSQMELHAFTRTLEGVDDLRKSAKGMGREIRRIKVRGIGRRGPTCWAEGEASP